MAVSAALGIYLLASPLWRATGLVRAHRATVRGACQTVMTLGMGVMFLVTL